MNFPKIDYDDLALFGSILCAAIGGGAVTASTTDNGWLAFGIALIVFGMPAAVLVFLASVESK